jgi:hypothetical protein
MVKKYTISVRTARRPIVASATKLGGQPVWVGEPCWPLSKALREPMRFIGQFALSPEIFGTCAARVAYLFMTDAETFVNGTWLPDGGENAVILQPGVWSGPSAPLTQGPTLCERVTDETSSGTKEVAREYEVELELGEDPDVLEEDEFAESGKYSQYLEEYLEESKIGGTPAFLENPEYPDSGRWRLLAQINSTVVPCGINFGDGGIGYVFLSEDGRVATFLWQG